MLRLCSIKSYCLVWMLLFVLFLAVGCSDETVRKKSTSSAKKTKPQAKSAALETESKPEVEEAPRFVYSPTGRRDPFQPLVTKETKKKEEKVPLTPLQRFELGQFRLQAVLIGKGEPRAMVSAPDGKTYILSPGIKIGKRDGVIREITREAVHVEEVQYDMGGSASRKIVKIEMSEPKLF